ncbi:MAG: FMN-dependent NADH-azoreductase [Pontibacterium sp.]
MSSLVRIDSSPRGADSHSKSIADVVESQLISVIPQLKITHHDVSVMAVPALSGTAITGFYTPKEEFTDELTQATELSDRLIAELKAADTLLISAPMYNFGVPSSLKAWIDQIVRINETFSYDDAGFDGLLKGKKAILALSYGAQGYVEGGPMESMNFFEPYLVALLGFLGIDDVEVFRLEGTSMLSPEALAANRKALDRHISERLNRG